MHILEVPLRCRRAKTFFDFLTGLRPLRWCSTAMESYDVYVTPPEAVRGCTTLNRPDFEKEFEFYGVKISDRNKKRCSSILQYLAHARVQCPYVKGVVSVFFPDDSTKLKELQINLGPAQIVRKLLTAEDHDWIKANEGEEFTHFVKLGYDNFTRKDILKAILPRDQDIASSYELVGHIAHYNLKERHFPYKSIIGQVTLDKEKKVRTVVNKVEALGFESTYRFFKMEVIAGEEDFVTQLSEQRCVFSLDYSKVYWNSRLEKEHVAIVELFKNHDVVLDVFAGVGPFTIPAAKHRRCEVHANDLNPHSYTYLLKNIKDNGVTGKVTAYNLDGKDFIVEVSRKLVDQSLRVKDGGNKGGSVVPYSHVVMNLPGDAPSFLGAFRGVFSSVPSNLRDRVVLPQIHCHCFVDAHEEGREEKALEKVRAHLEVESLEEGSYSVTDVRSVSSISRMMRVSFELPPEVAFSRGGKDRAQSEDASSGGGNAGRADLGGCGDGDAGEVSLSVCNASESTTCEEVLETGSDIGGKGGHCIDSSQSVVDSGLKCGSERTSRLSEAAVRMRRTKPGNGEHESKRLKVDSSLVN